MDEGEVDIYVTEYHWAIRKHRALPLVTTRLDLVGIESDLEDSIVWFHLYVELKETNEQTIDFVPFEYEGPPFYC